VPVRVRTRRPYGQPGVVGEQRDDAVHVAGLVGAGENLPGAELRVAHDVARNTYPPRLAVVAAGGDPGPDPHA
jgi:hypothetical protein